jgi:hypothetical protein
LTGVVAAFLLAGIYYPGIGATSQTRAVRRRGRANGLSLGEQLGFVFLGSVSRPNLFARPLLRDGFATFCSSPRFGRASSSATGSSASAPSFFRRVSLRAWESLGKAAALAALAYMGFVGMRTLFECMVYRYH